MKSTLLASYYGKPKTLILLRQEDYHEEQLINVTYILDGIGYREGISLQSKGWKWLQGDPGCWVTDKEAAAEEAKKVIVLWNDIRTL